MKLCKNELCKNFNLQKFILGVHVFFIEEHFLAKKKPACRHFSATANFVYLTMEAKSAVMAFTMLPAFLSQKRAEESSQ